MGITGLLQRSLENIILRMPRNANTSTIERQFVDGVKWMCLEIGMVSGERNRRLIGAAFCVIELHRFGYKYAPRKCPTCKFWMLPKPDLIGTSFQGFKDACITCDFGVPVTSMKDSAIS